MNYRYRKRPVVVEAFQMTPEHRASNEHWPNWLHEAWNADEDGPGSLSINQFTGELYVFTLEGQMHVALDDWIIRGVKGELYPCKPDIFGASYESCDDTDMGGP